MRNVTKEGMAVVCTGLLLLAGCVCPKYYAHVASGHLDIMASAEPVSRVVDRPGVPVVTRDRLILARNIRAFAVGQLLLPDNGSYTIYTELHRPYLMWSVVAAPEFGLDPLTWDFLFAGRLSYRGFFDFEMAREFAGKLEKDGYEVHIGNVGAYSTLGWFDDPLLSSFIHWPEAHVAELIFHELAHQALYVKDDTRFNESFAEMVAEEGVNRWFRAKKDRAAMEGFRDARQPYQLFVDLLMDTARQLRGVYGEPVSDTQKRLLKAGVFHRLEVRFESLKTKHPGLARFDGWFSTPLNNARFALLATYHDFVPAFRMMLIQCDNDLACFYARAGQLGRCPKPVRTAKLKELNQAYARAKGGAIRTGSP